MGTRLHHGARNNGGKLNLPVGTGLPSFVGEQKTYTMMAQRVAGASDSFKV